MLAAGPGCGHSTPGYRCVLTIGEEARWIRRSRFEPPRRPSRRSPRRPPRCWRSRFRECRRARPRRSRSRRPRPNHCHRSATRRRRRRAQRPVTTTAAAPAARHQQGAFLTTSQGARLQETDHSLKAGERGPTLLQDHHLREKITHFDHERIPERVVHARGAGAHGIFVGYGSANRSARPASSPRTSRRRCSCDSRPCSDRGAPPTRCGTPVASRPSSTPTRGPSTWSATTSRSSSSRTASSSPTSSMRASRTRTERSRRHRVRTTRSGTSCPCTPRPSTTRCGTCPTAGYRAPTGPWRDSAFTPSGARTPTAEPPWSSSTGSRDWACTR